MFSDVILTSVIPAERSESRDDDQGERIYRVVRKLGKHYSKQTERTQNEKSTR